MKSENKKRNGQEKYGRDEGEESIRASRLHLHLHTDPHLHEIKKTHPEEPIEADEQRKEE